MPYKVTEIEGIGEVFGAKLGAMGISTTDDLLEKGGSKKGRLSIAAETGIPESVVLTSVNHADLFRIKGVAGQFSELLEAAGVDSVKEFAQRNPANLQVKLVEINEKLGVSGRVPTETELEGMVEYAKGLDQKVFH